MDTPNKLLPKVEAFNRGPIITRSTIPIHISVWDPIHHRICWGCGQRLPSMDLCTTASRSETRTNLRCIYSIQSAATRIKDPCLLESMIGRAFKNLKSGSGLFMGSNKCLEQSMSQGLVQLVPRWVGTTQGRAGASVLVPGSIAVVSSVVAWIVLPNLLRRMYSYVECAPTTKLLGRTPLEKVMERVPYELSMFGALEDPARLLASVVTFSHLAYMVAPTSVAAHYLTKIWSGATVVSIVWFMYRWKSNVFARIVTGKSVGGADKERYLTMDRLSSLGLLILGCMAVAEACGMAVQSIMTVGGIGGVATAFAAKDVMGNMLCGVGLQFSRPFSVGDSITAGPVNGQVVEMGFHSTQILNSDKYPIIVPNSFFSSQVIVNKSRVRWRGMAFTLPIRLQDLDKVPAITAEVRKMLREHPIVYLETEMPRCHVTRVGGLSIELTVTCNLKPMGTDDFLITEEELLMQSSQIVIKTGALLGGGSCIP